MSRERREFSSTQGKGGSISCSSRCHHRQSDSSRGLDWRRVHRRSGTAQQTSALCVTAAKACTYAIRKSTHVKDDADRSIPTSRVSTHMAYAAFLGWWITVSKCREATRQRGISNRVKGIQWGIQIRQHVASAGRKLSRNIFRDTFAISRRRYAVEREKLTCPVKYSEVIVDRQGTHRRAS